MKKVLVLLGLDLFLTALITSLWWSGKIPTVSKAYLAKVELTTATVRHQIQGVLGLWKLPPLPVNHAATPSTNRQEGNLGEENERLTQELAQAQERIAQLQEQLKYYQDLNLKVPHPSYNYTGEDLFTEVNNYRRENNLGELAKDYNLCYLASFRLNQLLELGRLDNHQGFDDFKPADKFKYELVGENLAQGYATAYEVVYKGWLGSPGHHLLLSDSRLTLGCTAASRGLAVLIAGKEH